MVLRAQCNGKSSLYSPVDGSAYGWVGGAWMEFDLGEKDMSLPPGFTEAIENATDGSGNFVKIGVGILRKDTPVYSWGHDYPAVELAETQAKWDDRGDSVTFRQTLKGTGKGYAYELEETVRVRDNQMNMEYRLANTGRKGFTTEQYIHNFLVFSDHSVGPNYEIQLPYDFQIKGDLGSAIRREPGKDALEFWKVLPGAVKFRLSSPVGYQGPNKVTVTQSDVKQTITIETSLPPDALDLWCTARQLSPEMLVLVKLDAGQEKRRTRIYTFSTN